MEISFNKYLVWQCPSCGNWSGKQNNKWNLNMTDQERMLAINQINLKCRRCRKTTKLKDNTKGGIRVKHKWCDHPKEATIIIQKMQEYNATGKISD